MAYCKDHPNLVTFQVTLNLEPGITAAQAKKLLSTRLDVIESIRRYKIRFQEVRNGR